VVHLPQCPRIGDGKGRSLGRGRDWPEQWRGPPLGDHGAAVHRHSLDRLNAMNDSLKKRVGNLEEEYE